MGEVKLSMAIHKAIDYFLCDRCPTEAIDSYVADFFGNICPFNYIWDMKILPEEPQEKNHPHFWPRSAIEKLTGIDLHAKRKDGAHT